MPYKVPKDRIQCNWRNKDQSICENYATEKWIAIPYVDPYAGPFYEYWSEKPPPDISYRCDTHIARVIMLFAKKSNGLEAERMIRRLYEVEKL